MGSAHGVLPGTTWVVLPHGVLLGTTWVLGPMAYYWVLPGYLRDAPMAYYLVLPGYLPIP